MSTFVLIVIILEVVFSRFSSLGDIWIAKNPPGTNTFAYKLKKFRFFVLVKRVTHTNAM